MKIVSSREVYKCRLFRVTEEEATDPSGFDILVIIQLPGAGEIWSRVTPFETAVMQIVDRRIFPGLSNIRVIGQIQIRFE